MKLFLIVLLAGVWSTAVTAAPQSTPNFSFQEYALNLPSFVDFAGEGAEEVLHCVQVAVGRVLEESDVGPVYDDFKTKLEHLIKVELPRCQRYTTQVGKSLCQTVVVKRVADSLYLFVKELAATNKLELLKRMKDKVLEWCFGPQINLFKTETENEVEQFQVSASENILSRFECIADSLEKVSKAHNLQSLWEKSQPQIVHHLGQWKQCQQTTNTVLRYICQIKEGASTFIIITEYVKLAAAHDSKFVEYFVAHYKQHCEGKSADDVELFAVEEFSVLSNVQKLIEKIKCISQAITETVHETDFEHVWTQAQHDFEKLQDGFRDCVKQSSVPEAAKCIVKYTKLSAAVFNQFLANLKDANYDAYYKLKTNIKNKCYP